MKRGFVQVAALAVIGIVSLAAGAFAYLDYQHEQSTYQLGAFRPSNYVGKLLTRLNEGGAESTFNTTPGTAADGSTLTTAKIGDFAVFTINPGASNEEKISVSAVSVSGSTATWTIINRGLSYTENTAVTANKKQHAIGETVIISNDDHYLDVQFAAIDEDTTITGDWKVSTPANATSIANRNYVDGVAFGGVGGASETATGTVEISTGVEAASSTTNGSIGRLALPASLSTSTWNSATLASYKIPVVGPQGSLDQGFLPATTTKVFEFASTTYIGDFRAVDIGKFQEVFTATGTFSVPTGITRVHIVAQGGGAGGIDGSPVGDGGGAGAYCEGFLDVSATSSVLIGVGWGGVEGQSGGPSFFSTFVSAAGGSSSTGGDCTLGSGVTNFLEIEDLNGQPGAQEAGADPDTLRGGNGASTPLGSGGQGSVSTGEGMDGGSAGGYGAGGGGTDTGTAGNGTQGIVIVRW